MRKGFTLVECMVVGSILSFLTLALFEGVNVSSRMAHENSQFLAADALAFDVVWKRFNEPYDSLKGLNRAAENPIVETVATTNPLDEGAAPVLMCDGSTVKIYTVITNAADGRGVMIHANVAWGPSYARKCLAKTSKESGALSFNHDVGIYKSQLERGK